MPLPEKNECAIVGELDTEIILTSNALQYRSYLDSSAYLGSEILHFFGAIIRPGAMCRVSGQMFSGLLLRDLHAAPSIARKVAVNGRLGFEFTATDGRFIRGCFANVRAQDWSRILGRANTVQVVEPDGNLGPLRRYERYFRQRDVEVIANLR